MDRSPENEGTRPEDHRAQHSVASPQAVGDDAERVLLLRSPRRQGHDAAQGPGREPADLLLCGHHYRISREALKAAGAVAFDASGMIVMPFAWEAELEPLGAHRTPCAG
jgi:hypothetical protein